MKYSILHVDIIRNDRKYSEDGYFGTRAKPNLGGPEAS